MEFRQLRCVVLVTAQLVAATASGAPVVGETISLRASEDAAPPPVGHGLLFSSSWNTTTGISEEACTDGGRWPNVHGNSPNGVIEVKGDGVAGNNYMTYYVCPFSHEDGYASSWGGVWKALEGMVTSEHTFYRVYVRVYPHDQFKYGNGHFVQDFHYSTPDSGRELEGTQNVYWGVQWVKDNTWRPYITSLRKQEHTDERFNKWTWVTQRDFEMERWYRFEGHICWLDHERVSRAVWNVRVYDDKGELLKTLSDWSQSGISADQFLEEGHHFLLEGRDPTWMLCFNGPWITDPSPALLKGETRVRSHDLCAFWVRNDRWCGPVAGDVTPDGKPPAIAVTSPEASEKLPGDPGVATIKGTASDNTELYEVSWLSDNGATGKAEGTESWSASVPLREGPNVVRIIAVDKYLNSSEVRIAIVRDATGARVEGVETGGAPR